ncbi:hypothetical protein ACLB2K_040882 [Fragaria x ananassa]
MVATYINEVPADYDRKSELRVEVPRIFHHPPDEYSIHDSNDPEEFQFSIPVIDLEGLLDLTKQKEIVTKVGEVSETWGFFQIVNHGIAVDVLEEVKNGVRRFFEHDTEVKKKLYSRDHFKNPVLYNSNFDIAGN